MKQYGPIKEHWDETENSRNKDYFVDTGAPHYVSFNPSNKILPFGQKIRNSEKFQDIKGTNVNLVRALSEKEIEI